MQKRKMMYKKVLKIGILGLVLFSTAAFGEVRTASQPNGDNQINRYQTRDNGHILVGVDVPKTNNPNKRVVRDRVEMDTGNNQAKYRETQYKIYERDRVLNETYDPMILMTPVTRVIRPVDSIGVSTALLTQIVFPEEMIITDVLPSFKPETLEWERNVLRIRPSKTSFSMGNIIVTMTDERKNYTMTLFLERFFSKECEADAESKSYICKKQRYVGTSSRQKKYAYSYNNLSTLYRYVNPDPMDDLEVIALYERLMGKLLRIRKNLDAVSFSYMGVEYTITRNDKFGSFDGGVMYRGVGYRVTNSMGGER